MIKNVIFDLGNVLIDFKPIKYIKSLGYDDEKALEIFNKKLKMFIQRLRKQAKNLIIFKLHQCSIYHSIFKY